MLKKVCFFTGNRAEFSLQRPLIQATESLGCFETQLIVSGAHIDPLFGGTISEIEESGVKISRKTGSIKVDDSLSTVPQAIASSIVETSKYLDELKSDCLIVYADRYETFGAAVAATQSGIPLIHIEGGDVTEGGCLDDSLRHAITKLAHLHCATNEASRERILRMGEEEWRVRNIGLPSLDNIYKGEHASVQEVMENLSLDLKRPIIVFTLHSVTSNLLTLQQDVGICIDALTSLLDHDIQLVCTYPNNDPGSEIIIAGLNLLEEQYPTQVRVERSLGGYMYHGLLNVATVKGARLLSMGNSSSGIKETCYFQCIHINIGERQSGRLTSGNIINCRYDRDAIVSNAKRILFEESSLVGKQYKDPYWNGGAGERFSDFLLEISKMEISKLLVKKIGGTSLETV